MYLNVYILNISMHIHGLQGNNNNVRHITNQTLIFNFLLIVE